MKYGAKEQYSTKKIFLPMFSLAGRSRFNLSFSSFLPVSIVCDVISYHGIRQTVVCGCCGKSLFIGEWWHRGGKRMPVSRFFGRLRSLGTGLRYNPVNSFTRSCWPISFDVFVFKRKEEKDWNGSSSSCCCCCGAGEIRLEIYER